MDWDNEQICHWLTAMGLGEYVQVFRGMFVKLGITGKERNRLLSTVSLFLLVRERGGGGESSMAQSKGCVLSDG